MAADPNTDYWMTADIAEHLGVKVETVRVYRTRGDLPEPDRMFGRTPAWRPETILNWQRPGRGARTDLHG
ncbi:MarR family transcriptional regulator [Streptomyces sp. DSM 42041]|uniref:MarR family transcriptional regulator n=1 Tax=Streptomyces hazeniae TaxID=3075538 RepID=A0ABU2NJU1_9ACTN|nr:MarR family transcriptional regulator [Streptomyces sp. DSM 42041]MDT0377264.1 MarR family transcriptional regulator [Streptomyces sp. DSM 42041]